MLLLRPRIGTPCWCARQRAVTCTKRTYLARTGYALRVFMHLRRAGNFGELQIRIIIFASVRTNRLEAAPADVSLSRRYGRTSAQFVARGHTAGSCSLFRVSAAFRWVRLSSRSTADLVQHSRRMNAQNPQEEGKEERIFSNGSNAASPDNSALLLAQPLLDKSRRLAEVKYIFVVCIGQTPQYTISGRCN